MPREEKQQKLDEEWKVRKASWWNTGSTARFTKSAAVDASFSTEVEKEPD